MSEPPRPAPSFVLGRMALIALGTVYLAGVWLEGVGSSIPSKILPRTPLYFVQIAKLFPHAAVNVIDSRAEGWLCKEKKWQELDTRAFFPLDPDDKENRFQRLVFFYPQSRPTMQALDEFIVKAHAAGTLDRPDGVPSDDPLGGIRVLSLKTPVPAQGTPIEPVSRKPLSDYPESARKVHFHTRRSKIAERCGYRDPASTVPDDDKETKEAREPGERSP